MYIYAADLTFFSTAPGQIVKALLAIFGFAMIIKTIFGAFKSFAGGKPGEGFKQIIIGILVCTFLFYPELIGVVIDLFKTMIEKFLGNDGVGKIVEQNGGGGSTPAPPAP